MRAARGALLITAAALFVLAGCSKKEPLLMNLRSTGNGPDEFSILPPKPLEMPEDLAALPTPEVGGVSRTDPNPFDDAIVALGGNPQVSRGVPASDGALVNHARRNGVEAGIRQTLAAEDLEWRRSHDGRLLERLFNVTVYFRAYEKMSLDQHAELARWRRAGVGNPSAPPEATR
ncbi:DUF3035 domain-containing protein [Rhodobacter ferrooxidans]|uniref:Pyruvate/2-oxoglutarate dehydrogenase complex, dihydrolipoamide acyltransferase (E2) component n=1 Tax=Rhodobacter ferrooxidans TaxID=371731 RepID=C8RXG6_9RHOB|nr:DUF3035 domain-containing protein [Rhodobacter sp. SW2]EEW26691.1 conserved hypothetical protein [Rhodobacter sp. SW2]